MTSLLSLPVSAGRKPDTRELLPLDQYTAIIVSFSGGKDSLALVLHLLELGVRKERLQLWHQAVDGEKGVEDPFMDWPVTESYVRAVGRALGIRVLFQWREGGFLGEMLKENARTRPIRFERQDGTLGQAGGLKGKIGTRRRFPQKTADLRVRWCSAVLKIDVTALAINNDPAFRRDARILFVTGERRQESQGRALYAEREPHRCDRRQRRVDAWRAVIDWDEQDVWAIMARWRIRPHPAYFLGFSRVSCALCVFGLPDQWASLRHIDPVRFARVLAYEKLFGCTISPGRSVWDQAERGRVYPQCHDARLVSLAMSHDYPADQVFVPEGEEWELPAGAFKRGGGPI